MLSTDRHDATLRARDAAIESRANPMDPNRFLAALGMQMGFAQSQEQGGLSARSQVDSLYGWVYVAVERIRSSVAQVPLRCKWRNDDGSEPETITDLRHPLVKLFENPNPLDTKFDFWSATITYRLLCGAAYWLKTRAKAGGEVRELWPMPSQYMQPWYSNDGRYLLGYSLVTGGSSLDVPLSDLVVLKNVNPANRFVGYSTLAAASEAVKTKDAIRAARLKTLDNDILASKFFTTDQRLTPDDAAYMTASIVQRHSGPNKAGLPVVLYGGVKPAAGVDNPEIPFRESDKDTRDEILGAFGVPPLLAGVVENANNSNTASQENVYAKYTIRPQCVSIEQSINKDLVTEFNDPTLFVEFDNCVPEDRKLDADIANVNTTAGITTINEEREKIGLAPVAWGDKPRWLAEAEAVGAAAIAAAEQQQSEQQQAAQQNNDPQPEPPVEDDEDKSDVQAGGPPSETKSRRRPTALRQRHLETLGRSIRKDYDRLESATVPTLRKYFANQAVRIANNVKRIYSLLALDVPGPAQAVPTRTAEFTFLRWGQDELARVYHDGTTVRELGTEDVGILERCVELPPHCWNNLEQHAIEIRELPPGDLDNLDDWERAADDLAGRMLPKIREAIGVGAATQGDELRLQGALDLNSPTVERWLRQKDRDYWKGTVNQTTRDLLGEKLADVLADRPTLAKMLDVVEEVMGSRIKSSAETIARTEVVGGYNAGAQLVRDEVGVERKEWIATLDERTRMAHSDADGEIVRQDDKFNVGGELLSHPGDPTASVSNIVNCRCSCVAIIDDED